MKFCQKGPKYDFKVNFLCQECSESFCFLITLVESFYSVKYWLSIITSNARQIISVMKTKTLVFQRNNISKILHFDILIHVLSWNIYFRLLRKNPRTESQQLFDGIIDVTLFDGVEGLDFNYQNYAQLLTNWHQLNSQSTVVSLSRLIFLAKNLAF